MMTVFAVASFYHLGIVGEDYLDVVHCLPHVRVYYYLRMRISWMISKKWNLKMIWMNDDSSFDCSVLDDDDQ